MFILCLSFGLPVYVQVVNANLIMKDSRCKLVFELILWSIANDMQWSEVTSCLQNVISAC